MYFSFQHISLLLRHFLEIYIACVSGKTSNTKTTSFYLPSRNWQLRMPQVDRPPPLNPISCVQLCPCSCIARWRWKTIWVAYWIPLYYEQYKRILQRQHVISASKALGTFESVATYNIKEIIPGLVYFAWHLKHLESGCRQWAAWWQDH